MSSFEERLVKVESAVSSLEERVNASLGVPTRVDKPTGILKEEKLSKEEESILSDALRLITED